MHMFPTPQVLQGLVDDDLVHQERIGASNYFWCDRRCGWRPAERDSAAGASRSSRCYGLKCRQRPELQHAFHGHGPQPVEAVG